ncbi:myo-inositol-1(or 4)-monophosphatase [Cladophialophora yegresii CBS 114405]|uniref:Inositol-1-monophosphatase n=1 Tax=Cladophialophora yegresii CBS 114405 TaxID=1182544 RepID=W9WG09_9EURO|nr:myo-inositol-1(or 4)-monophosphatase [Cladophialophora yegresii CBS 114405]EXJ63925.1 myo-inositol-1(or 4)-monophosphatase [Cladophialophora yegresii CBS 114405]
MASPIQHDHDIPDDDELRTIYTFAIQLAKDAGKMLLDSLYARRRDGQDGRTPSNPSNEDVTPQELTTREKLNAVDIVTQTDLQVEAFIHAAISARYPTHDFIGEEMYSASHSGATSGTSKEYRVTHKPTWIVDPLDGTVNFTHGFPMFCVSIALVVNQVPVVGVIYAPLLGQLFSACKGQGAFLNEATRLPLLGSAGVGPIPSDAPRRCIFSCEWGKDRREGPTGNMRRKVDSFVTMASEVDGPGGKGGMVHGMRSLGSAALDLAYVAMGSFDIWWEGGCWEWDVAAGICLVHEAGGLVTTANPPEDWEKGRVEDAKLGGRLYLAIRPASDCESGETARQGQERCVREVWRRVRTLDYDRPGG